MVWSTGLGVTDVGICVAQPVRMHAANSAFMRGWCTCVHLQPHAVSHACMVGMLLRMLLARIASAHTVFMHGCTCMVGTHVFMCAAHTVFMHGWCHSVVMLEIANACGLKQIQVLNLGCG